MSSEPKRIVPPPCEPASEPDPSTQKEIDKREKDQEKATRPTPSALLNDHRERTELRLIDEVDQARDKNDSLVDELRDIERRHSALYERHKAAESQRSSSAIGAAAGTLLLTLASFNEKYRLALVFIGATAAVLAILLDIRACVESWWRPVDKPKK